MVVIRVRKNKDLMWKLAQACEAYEVRKRISFAMLLYAKNAIILPRQARDTHRESTQNRNAFSCRHPARRARNRRSAVAVAVVVARSVVLSIKARQLRACA